ncbi:MAG TPA: hypothetical protein VGN77_08300, partial [Steroidobacteraceae bacterium]|nr:hypothetical protein [Steroidobacteraceae bacterium]
MAKTKSGVSRCAGALLVCALSVLCACTTKSDRRKSETADLALVLPGVYSNPKQVLLILNVFAPFLKGNVLYVRESDAVDT